MVLRRSFCGLLVLAAAACVSPTIPLPPPELPSIARGSEPLTAHLVGRNVEPNAIIVVYNLNTGVPRERRVTGAQADEKGNWECDVRYAQEGEFVSVAQEVDGERSSARSFPLRF